MTKIKNDNQFAYFAQGFFEIAGTDNLSEDQTRKLAKVANEVEQKGKVSQFVLSTVLDKGFEGVGPTIAAFVNETFEHDIDPSYEGNQDNFQNLHDGNTGRRPNRPLPGRRC